MSTRTLELLETERLILERLRADHAGDLIGLLQDPRVARTLWPFPTPQSDAEVIAGLQDKIAHWERYGFGLWLMRDRATGQFVGRGGLQHTAVEGEPTIEVGWAVVPERWGEGLATELARASVEVAFGDLGLRELVAFTLPHNIASRRVMEKAGFVYDREVTHVGLLHVLYVRRP